MSIQRRALLAENAQSGGFLCWNGGNGASTSDGCGVNLGGTTTVSTVKDSDATQPPELVSPGFPVPDEPGSSTADGSGSAVGTSWPARSLGLALPVAAAGAGAGALVLLQVRDPHIEGSYGLCPVYALFGVYCPGCGGMRAVHNLTDGHIIDSLHSNLLALPMLVLFALWVGDWAVRAWRGEGPRLPEISSATMWILLGSIAGYTVLRNTPWGTWLTPV